MCWARTPEEYIGQMKMYFPQLKRWRKALTVSDDEAMKANPKASIYFCDTKGFKGMMLCGTMEVLTDAASKEMIWRKGDTARWISGSYIIFLFFMKCRKCE